MTSLAVFVSGSGTNCENLIRHFSGSSDIQVSLVVSSRKDAPAIGRASALGVPVKVITKSEFSDRDFVMKVLNDFSIDYIILAGFLAMVPSWLVSAYEGRIINIHPSLLPKFGGKGMYGRHVHEAVKAAGEEETGMTVHYVSDEVDGGKIIAQYRVGISPKDTVEDISAKEHELEMRYFPSVVESVVKKNSGMA